jgi:chromosomal replication initiation ATPase DnaA
MTDAMPHVPAAPAAPAPARRNPTPLTRAVAAAFAVRAADIESASRGPAATARARQAAIYLARVVLGMTFVEAGRLYGRDRTTAAHACRVIEDLRDDERFDRLLAQLEARLAQSGEVQP